MKQIFFLLIFISAALTTKAQDDPTKLAGKADKMLTRYYMNNNDMENLKEAKTLIDKAAAIGLTTADDYKTKGEIYAQYGITETLLKQLKNQKLEHPDAAIIASDAYMKSFELYVKDRDKKKVIEKLAEVINPLNAAGSDAIAANDFESAYQNFKRIVTILDMIKANDGTWPLQKPEDFNNIIYVAGLTAFNSNHKPEATEYYLRAYNNGMKTAEIYDGLYRVYIDDQEDKAIKYLKEGRAAFPDDNNLLFSQINYSLKKGELENLIADLNKAIALEPENISVINTTGNVFDKLYQTASEKNDTAKANEYYAKALEYYNMALNKDPKNGFALYSIGTLYYNKAAFYINKMNALADDISATGMKKYNDYQAKTREMFDKALPFFQKAEEVDPKDKNTLIALREIYARLNDLEKSKEYKEKIEALGK